jgi:hypothetical protein
MSINEKLIQIQNSLIKENPLFPKNMCSLSAKQVYDELGFLPVAGYVLTSQGFEKHSWNIDSNGKIIDLTLYQFGKNAGKIIYSNKDELIDSWGYFENKESTEFLRKYIQNFEKSFFR